MSIKKIFFNTSVVLALFIGLNFVAIAKVPSIPYNHNKGAYEIFELRHLNELEYCVSGAGVSQGNYWNSYGKTFILMDDIAGFDKSIGTESDPFMGTFDGNGKTITISINLTAPITTCIGVFGKTIGATIKNLTVAGLVSYNHASIFASSIGGIIGIGDYTTITNCTNLADITSSGAGALFVGGIVGELTNSTITFCSNSGDIVAIGHWYVGGIVGGASLNGGTLSNCVNTGTIKGSYRTGGIAGGFASGHINNCANAGWISGSYYVGGIMGIVISLESMHSCLNTGVVQGTSYVQSLIGYRDNNYSIIGKISNCYYDNQMSIFTGVQGMTDAAAGVQGLSTYELADPAIKNALGGAWTITPNTFYAQSYSYPTLYGIVGADNNVNVHALAAMPVRLLSGACWNDVGSSVWIFGPVVTLDVGYWTQQASWRVSNSPIQWEAKADFMNMPIQSTETVPNGSYSRHFHNPTGYPGLVELTAYMNVDGYIYKKTVPIITNGTPFKINIDEYEMYGFETSEVTPNIVTNNAVIDVSSAIEGNLHIAIFDMSGAEVMNVVDKNVTAQSQTQVELNDLQNLASGSYMVAVSLGNNVVFRKFIKQ